MSIADAFASAKRAGHASGDTGGFDHWVCKTGLQNRGYVAALRKEYETAAIGGIDERASTTFKGVTIRKSGDREYVTDLDRDSRFESVEDAKNFIAAQVLSNPRHPGVNDFLRVTSDPAFRNANAYTRAAILTINRRRSA